MRNIFTLSSKIDTNKVFIVNRSEIEERLDVEYYRPEILSLERKVRAVSSKRLRNYICRISSGATPSVKEEGKFYSDKENGIPFLRVQNLQTNGKISLEDVKYINQETHENYLRRSQVGEHDLLVKITGVGRMAIASVTPPNFVGNTNQHMVVIKTENKSISEYLANYLNLDFVEKLASRRSTGGTRPALDYPALKSIPIIEGIDFSAIERAEKIKQQKEAEAKAFLDGIDDYLMDELGISMPTKDNNINNRIFIANSSNIWSDRFDAKFHKSKIYETVLFGGTYPIMKVKSIISSIKTGTTPHNSLNPFENSGIIFLRNSNLQNGELNLTDVRHVRFELHDQLTFSMYNELIVCIAGTVGDAAINREKQPIAINQNVSSLVIDCTLVLPEYLCYYFNSDLNCEIVKRQCSIATIMYLNNSNLLNIPIPIPPMNKQMEIANYISKIRAKAKTLQKEAQDILDNAKREVEQMILGE